MFLKSFFICIASWKSYLLCTRLNSINWSFLPQSALLLLQTAPCLSWGSAMLSFLLIWAPSRRGWRLWRVETASRWVWLISTRMSSQCLRGKAQSTFAKLQYENVLFCSQFLSAKICHRYQTIINWCSDTMFLNIPLFPWIKKRAVDKQDTFYWDNVRSWCSLIYFLPSTTKYPVTKNLCLCEAESVWMC